MRKICINRWKWKSGQFATQNSHLQNLVEADFFRCFLFFTFNSFHCRVLVGVSILELKQFDWDHTVRLTHEMKNRNQIRSTCNTEKLCDTTTVRLGAHRPTDEHGRKLFHRFSRFYCCSHAVVVLLPNSDFVISFMFLFYFGTTPCPMHCNTHKHLYLSTCTRRTVNRHILCSRVDRAACKWK